MKDGERQLLIGTYRTKEQTEWFDNTMPDPQPYTDEKEEDKIALARRRGACYES